MSEQPTLFDMPRDWEEEWEGMPEFKRSDNAPAQKIVVNFKTYDDVRKFAELIGQRLSPQTDTIWYPQNKTPTGIFRDES